ncbi:STAS domain-containing protein [candidate division KSB1 bacterium]
MNTIKIANMINFNFNKEENTLICELQGRMGADNALELSVPIQKELDVHLVKNENKSSLKVQFNMQDVSYIASSFIRICITIAKQLDEGNFSMTKTSPMIKKTMKIAGLDEILNVS